MKTSTLKNNKDMIHFNLFNQDELSGRKSRFLAILQLLRRVVAICLLALTSIGAWAADYVFMQGSNYIIISGGSLTTTTDFSPSTCLWSGTSGGAFTNNGYTLKYSQTYSESGGLAPTRTYNPPVLSTNTNETIVSIDISSDGTVSFEAPVSGQRMFEWYITDGTWYIQYNASDVVASTTSSSTNNIKAYLVTITDYPALSHIEGIEGIDAIGLTGTYDYTRIGSAIATTPACTKYTFNGETYYKLSDNTITTTNPNPVSSEFTYTWSASCNDATYTGFSINSNTGALSITSLPTTDKTITITLQATKTGQETQTVTKTVNVSNRPPTGVVGGTVYLNDYEDHTWTYYAGVDESVDGGNYNTNYAGKMYSPDPRNVKITYQANGGQVSISETETEFVYYKTIEKVGGTYKYQVISNPFSKRPTGKGFGGWEVVSGGDYIGKSTGDVLNLDEELTLTAANLKNVAGGDYVSNCTSAEIVLKAHWENATITNITSNTNTTIANSGTYETNLVVVKCGFDRTLTINGPCTIMMVEPDGSADYRTYTLETGITPPTGGIAKIEFAKWDPDGNIAMGGRNLWIGRGVTCTGDTRSVTLAGNSVSNQIVKIESGKYTTLTHYSGSPSTNSTTPLQRLTLGNDYDRAKKDWETSSPTLEFTGNFILAGSGWGGTYNIVSDNVNGSNTYMVKVLSKSGKFMTGTTVSAAAYSNSYYLSVYGSGRTGKRYLEIEGGEWVNIAGGRDDDRNGTKNTKDYIAFALRMRGGHVKGSIYGGAEQYSVQGSRQIVITGGEVNGWVAGGANGTTTNNGATTGKSYVYVGGNARVDSKGSTTSIGASLGGNIYAAGCGYNTTSSSGEVTLGTNVVFADEAYVERGVYGGGAFGFCSNNQTANVYITGGIVNGASGTYQTRGNSPTTTPNVIGGVFGGARQNIGGYANVYMTGGLVKSGLFGGSNNSGILSNDVNIVVTGGQVGTTSTTANIHGGGYGQNTGVSGNVDVTLGTRNITTGETAGIAVVYGDVYGGSALGSVNGTSATTTYHTNVTLNAGTINGSLYGGALGNSSTAANVYGPVAVKVYGGSVKKTDENGANGSGAVYGANNINGTPKGRVTVDIYGTNSAPEGEYALYSVYGGGNKADYKNDDYPEVVIHNCDNSIEYVYGGGNAAAVTNTNVTIYGGNKIGNVFGGGNGQVTPANVEGNTYLMIYGGTIGDVYGGSNSQGEIDGDIEVRISPEVHPDAPEGSKPCPINIDNVYGGGNMASSQAGLVYIGCDSYEAKINIGNVYGGANQADITSGNIELNITAGNIDNVFGGNNTSGNISGSITVTVDDEGSGCGMEVGNIYGGGNKAAYTGSPIVNIYNGHLTGSVFGGGLGSTAVVTGNPQVTIGSTTSTDVVTIDGNVFGGGDAAEVTGNTTVNLTAGSVSSAFGGGNLAAITGTTAVNLTGATAANVYGGGNEAGVSSTATVAMSAGSVTGGLYGGCNTKGKVSGDITVGVTGGTIGTDDSHKANVHGGGYGSLTQTGEDVAVTINGSGVTINGDVYGGSALGSVNDASTETTTVTLTSGTINGDLYGGGLGDATNAADVTGSTVVIINGGTVNNVFGCNNTNGDPAGASVTVNGGTINNNVYGGGNLAAASVSPVVTINNGTLPGSVFGGGKGAPSDASHETAMVTGNPQVVIGDDVSTHSVSIAGNVFGGGDAANVKGATTVTVNKCNTLIGAKTSGAWSTTAGTVYGGGNAADVVKNGTTGGSTSVVVNGGDIYRVFGGGNGEGTDNPGANVANGTNVAIHAGNIHQAFAGSNAKGNITGTSVVTIDHDISTCNELIDEVYGGGNLAAGNAGAVTVECGAIISDLYGGANQADIGTSTNPSNITLNVTGGTINRVFGGNNTSGNIYGSITVNVEKADDCGLDLNYVYGAGNQASYAPTTAGAYPAVNILKGTVKKDVFGGGLGSTAVVTSNPTILINGGSVTGNVFGGGSEANTVGTTSVTVRTGSVGADVYGGGALANITGNTTVSLTGGTVTGNIYGGGLGRQADAEHSIAAVAANVTGTTSVTISDGEVSNVFGCNNINGAPATSATVTVNGGTISNNVYGGGNLAAASVSPVVTINNGTFPGSVFGGGLGASAIITGNPLVTIGNNDDDQQVTIRGNVFGGGDAANVAGKPKVVINDCATIIGTYTGSGESLVWSTTDGTVYGGGNAADITGTGNGTDVTINGGKIHRAFGGGNGAGTDNPGANVAGNTLLTIKGGTVGEAFGGSNARGTIGGTPNVVIDDAVGDCQLSLLDLYGGGNETPSEGGHLIVKGCKHIRNVYGGANNANITSDIEVTIKSGYIQNVFGGNNNGGNITGSIIVNIDWDGSDCWNVDNVYGAGNLATYTAPTTSTYGDKAGKFPEVNIKNGKVNYNVFGAGKGDGSKVGSTEVYKGQVTGNPQVKLIGGSCKNIYGGGEGAPVNGNTNVTINATDRPANEGEYHVEECVFGGGLGATAVINGSTNITITGSSAIHGNVYGGGNAGLVTGDTHIDIK